jgi:hypothetical protein
MSDEELHDCLEALSGEANTRYKAIAYHIFNVQKHVHVFLRCTA